MHHSVTKECVTSVISRLVDTSQASGWCAPSAWHALRCFFLCPCIHGCQVLAGHDRHGPHPRSTRLQYTTHHCGMTQDLGSSIPHVLNQGTVGNRRGVGGVAPSHVSHRHCTHGSGPRRACVVTGVVARRLATHASAGVHDAALYCICRCILMACVIPARSRHALIKVVPGKTAGFRVATMV